MLRKIAPFLIAATLLGACGKDNNFQATDTPDFQVDGDGFLRIVMPRNESRTDSFGDLILRNTGDAALTVSKMAWIDRPSRLIALGERSDQSCTADAECGADAVCLTASSTCVSTLLPETPFEIARQTRKDITFAVSAGPSEMPCPEPTIEVPSIYQADYCGSLEIETNAQNDQGEIVTDGKAIIYFLDPGASGLISAEPSFLEFTNVQPGTTHTQSFSVTNAGESDLDVDSLGVEDNQQYFSITPLAPLTIPSGQAQVFDVTLTVPAGATDYEIFTTLNIASSAGNETVAIEVTADAGSAPVIELNTDVLRFDAGASQTVTVTNTGEATLSINGLNVSPVDARAFYSYSIDGQDRTSDFGPAVTIPKGESKDIVVDFARPAGNEDPAIGLLEIAHNDRNNGFKSEVTLLGDAGDVPIARISPESFMFLAADGNSASRSFVIRNVGTAALDLTAVSWNFSTGSNAEFQISPMSGTVAPGALFEGTVNFAGMNATPDVGLAILDSNNSSPIELSLRALDSAAEEPVATITVSNQGSLVANSPVNLTAASSTPAGVTTNAIWTLLSRPAGSSTWFTGVGETASFTPDTAGTYKVALTLGTSDRESQATMDIVVE